MTIADWLQVSSARLASAGVEASSLEAQLLAAHVLGVARTRLLAFPEEDFPELAGESVLQRRLAGEPLAYILGEREFYGRPFRVTPAVLIPRQDTETLIEATLEALDEGPKNILDIGTGSGCLAITLKLERPNWRVWAVDISASALDVARDNAEWLGADVDFRRSDLFTELLGLSFDAIVSNPPYIGQDEVLPKEVAQWEPPEALFAGPSGLDVYVRISRLARLYLRPGGLALMEVGHTQADDVFSIFKGGGWMLHEIRRDLAGIARVVAMRSNNAPGEPY